MYTPGPCLNIFRLNMPRISSIDPATLLPILQRFEKPTNEIGSKPTISTLTENNTYGGVNPNSKHSTRTRNTVDPATG